MSERIIDQGADDAERVAELALRPKNLNEFVGQLRVRDQLDLLLSAAKQRKATADHILFSGPPGLGKTTLAMIVAAEMDCPIRITSGPATQKIVQWQKAYKAKEDMLEISLKQIKEFQK